jgi:hypothetical protein
MVAPPPPPARLLQSPRTPRRPRPRAVADHGRGRDLAGSACPRELRGGSRRSTALSCRRSPSAGGGAARFGTAILLDCHSMPPRDGGRRAGRRASATGTAPASRRVWIARPSRGAGLRASKSRATSLMPAATSPQRHGRPAEGIHALQLEIDRSLYLDEACASPGPGFDARRADRRIVVRALAAAALARSRRRRSPPNSHRQKKDHLADREVAKVQGGTPKGA